eukprot:3548929-Pleurochrysis_carterae.AAC.1
MRVRERERHAHAHAPAPFSGYRERYSRFGAAASAANRTCAHTGMPTLPATSIILYATRGISCWISSEWNFLPITAFTPVIVLVMLDVICKCACGVMRERGKRAGQNLTRASYGRTNSRAQR